VSDDVPNILGFEIEPDGRWILGRRTAKPCPHCDEAPERTVAANGRAEIWHRPFFCCAKARSYNARMRAIDEVSKEETGWNAATGGGSIY
jgi:hypothetical protein